jgi:hypothetical protein
MTPFMPPVGAPWQGTVAHSLCRAESYPSHESSALTNGKLLMKWPASADREVVGVARTLRAPAAGHRVRRCLGVKLAPLIANARSPLPTSFNSLVGSPYAALFIVLVTTSIGKSLRFPSTASLRPKEE